MKLIHEKTGVEVKIGEVVTDFRGDKSTVTSMQEPKTPNSSGRVYVKDAGSEFERGLYPSVFGLKFVDE